MGEVNKITVTDKLKEQVAGALDRQPILFGYLYGSAITDHIHDESDIDAALYFKPDLSANERFDAQLAVIEALGKVFKVNDDLINITRLQDAPHLLQYVIISEGVVLYDEDHSARVNYELRVIKRESDEQGFRRAYDSEFLRRLSAQQA